MANDGCISSCSMSARLEAEQQEGRGAGPALSRATLATVWSKLIGPATRSERARGCCWFYFSRRQQPVTGGHSSAGYLFPKSTRSWAFEFLVIGWRPLKSSNLLLARSPIATRELSTSVGWGACYSRREYRLSASGVQMNRPSGPALPCSGWQAGRLEYGRRDGSLRAPVTTPSDLAATF